MKEIRITFFMDKRLLAPDMPFKSDARQEGFGRLPVIPSGMPSVEANGHGRPLNG